MKILKKTCLFLVLLLASAGAKGYQIDLANIYPGDLYLNTKYGDDVIAWGKPEKGPDLMLAQIHYGATGRLSWSEDLRLIKIYTETAITMGRDQKINIYTSLGGGDVARVFSKDLPSSGGKLVVVPEVMDTQRFGIAAVKSQDLPAHWDKLARDLVSDAVYYPFAQRALAYLNEVSGKIKTLGLPGARNLNSAINKLQSAMPNKKAAMEQKQAQTVSYSGYSWSY